MEKDALNIALTRLREILNVVELATDASLTIKKLTSKSDQNLSYKMYVLYKYCVNCART